MQFPPATERWRSLVSKYFPPELVDKALWTIQHESGGDPAAVGDKGVARGLFQIQDNRAFSNRPDAAFLDVPENNIKYAAEQLGAAAGNFGAWGEGTLHEGKPFGAFGNNSYDGSATPMSTGGSRMPDSAWYTNYAAKHARWDALDKKTRPYGENVFYRAGQGLFGQEPAGVDEYGRPKMKEVLLLSDAEYSEWDTLGGELDDLEAEYEQTGGGSEGVDDAIRRATFAYDTDPRNIDAENAAARYGRELDARGQAVSLATNNLREQNQVQQEAEGSFNDAMTGSNRWGSTFRAPRTSLPTSEDIYSEAVKSVKSGLPDVPDKPYYSGPPLPVGSGSLPPLETVRRTSGEKDKHGNRWNPKGYWENSNGEVWQDDGSQYGKWYPSVANVPAIERGKPGGLPKLPLAGQQTSPADVTPAVAAAARRPISGSVISTKRPWDIGGLGR